MARDNISLEFDAAAPRWWSLYLDVGPKASGELLVTMARESPRRGDSAAQPDDSADTVFFAYSDDSEVPWFGGISIPNEGLLLEVGSPAGGANHAAALPLPTSSGKATVSIPVGEDSDSARRAERQLLRFLVFSNGGASSAVVEVGWNGASDVRLGVVSGEAPEAQVRPTWVAAASSRLAAAGYGSGVWLDARASVASACGLSGLYFPPRGPGAVAGRFTWWNDGGESGTIDYGAVGMTRFDPSDPTTVGAMPQGVTWSSSATEWTFEVEQDLRALSIAGSLVLTPTGPPPMEPQGRAECGEGPIEWYPAG